MSALKLVFLLFKLSFKLALFLLEVVFWCLFLLKQLFLKLFDLGKAARSVKDGILRCPRGHEIPTFGGKYECSECGWVSDSPIYECRNPECRAITPYINCPTCGLSVRNPFRVGRP